MSSVPFSGEPITIVEVAQPFCANAHGVAPCTATAAACFNTRSTCQDPANYSGTVKKLYFGIPGEGRPSDALYIFPLLRSVSTSPARVNISGADKRANPLGIRATAKIQFRDMPHTDRIVDPYLASRSYEPLDQGTFWSKWNERNRYGRNGLTVTIYEGFSGQALADMESRVYISEGLDLSGDDVVTMSCRDVLAKASTDKAKAPRVSPGELQADITSSATTIKVAGAVLSDYAASGTVRINDEVMTYSAVAEDGSGFLDFTISARGTDNTTPAEHDAEDRVQECLRFDNTAPDVALATLYQEFTEISAAYLPLTDWADEAATHLSAYGITALVTEPTGVDKLLGEILEQIQAVQWWDERDKQIKFVAVKPIFEEPRLLTDEAHILAGSVKLREFPDRRVSRVYVYFDRRSPIESAGDGDSYRRMQGSVALELEAPEVYGEPAVREIFARFVNSSAVALETSTRILARYKEGARELTFSVSDKDRDIRVGQIVRIRHRRIQDTFGAPLVKPWIVTSIEVQHRQRRILVTADDASLAGQVYKIAEDTVGDWVGDGSDPYGVMFISDDNGLLPDGSEGFKIN